MTRPGLTICQVTYACLLLSSTDAPRKAEERVVKYLVGVMVGQHQGKSFSHPVWIIDLTASLSRRNGNVYLNVLSRWRGSVLTMVVATC
jgi:hypothetical protein